ncbi:putative quinol monooxygenase [Klebsiella huaxiensis]|uniref:Monooxygenase n=1 Tax=Klebsiella huaxiensis TaxID=2153354 RepID=A0A564KY40_9ENTR|nr:putative quinol monooxygenase [Klebsiella huaxiensis]VUS74133.1 Putative monooxygenase [Klebsiella huaxiensis]
MLKVIAEDFIQPEWVETVLPLYRELVAATQKEPLCIAYDLYIDAKDSGHFIFIEEWPDRAALDEHCASEHFRRLVPLIDQHKRKGAHYILMDSSVNPNNVILK